MLRSLGSSAQAASLRRAGVGLLRRWYRPDLDPIVPSPDRVLHAVPRKSSELGTIHSREMRAAGRLPVILQGDGLPFVNLSVAREALMPFLRRTHYQRELLTLEVEGGEKVRVLTQEVQYDDLKRFNVKHVNFRRWPRDPLRHPVKLPVPIIFVNEETHPTIKTGGYTHDIFSDTGLKCLVRDPENIPRFLVADMRRADGMDLRMEHLTVPPGVTIRPNARTLQNGGNFLVGRVKRVRG
jgi:large subunit ribosomal protein L25